MAGKSAAQNKKQQKETFWHGSLPFGTQLVFKNLETS